MEHPSRSALGALSTLTAALLALLPLQAQHNEETAAALIAAAGWTKTQQDGFAFMLTQQKDGAFFIATPQGNFPDPGLSGLALAALQTKPADLRSEDEQKLIDQGLAALLKQQNDDGSFGRRNTNYTTCAVMLALAKAHRDEFSKPLEKAQHYILGIQNIEDRGFAKEDRDYGSVGYGGDQRGDLSNLSFAIQALRESGLPANDEALSKAVVFLQRSQNRRESNDFAGRVKNGDEWQEVVSGDDGGAMYYPGNSTAGYVELPDGKVIPRSYGSMTYSLLKCYILAGIPADDPRVQAAVDWIQGNWSVEINPGSDPALGKEAQYQGLYYYYMVLAQALDEAGIEELTVPANDEDAEPRTVHWKAELSARLEELQHDDGSWLNEESGRWWEDKPLLCTTFALLALERCR